MSWIYSRWSHRLPKERSYDRLQAGEVLNKLGGLRTLYLETGPEVCFINGERLPILKLRRRSGPLTVR